MSGSAGASDLTGAGHGDDAALLPSIPGRPDAPAAGTARPAPASGAAEGPARRPPIPAGPYLVVGLARSGIAAASALRRIGAEVIGTDAGPVAAGARLSEEGVEVHSETDGIALLDRVATVIKSPGVPASAPVIEQARARGITVMGELELAWRLLQAPTIAVTGTNGKTTTVHLIAAIHRAAGLPVAVAGNVGLALSALVGRIDSSVTVVCEASSFQLQDTIAFAPEAAVLLNIAPDHLDRHASFEEYVEAKLQAFARQREGDTAVLPSPEPALPAGSEPAPPPGLLAALRTVGEPTSASVGESPAQAGPESASPPSSVSPPGAQESSGPLRHRIATLGGRARVLGFGTGDGAEVTLRQGRLIWRASGAPELELIGASDLRIRGDHNVSNAMAAAAACLASGVAVDAVREGLLGFAGVEHRLEEVASREQVLYVNDSKATNVASTLVALAAFGDGSAEEPDAERRRAAGCRHESPAVDDERGRGRPPAQAPGRGLPSPSRRRIHLILGGQGKGQDFRVLREPVSGSCAAVYLIGRDAQSIQEALTGIDVPLELCGDLETALRRAAATVRRTLAADRWVAAARGGAPGRAPVDPGDRQVVLLSPGCASFDQFQDFEARGARFREIVASL